MNLFLFLQVLYFSFKNQRRLVWKGTSLSTMAKCSRTWPDPVLVTSGVGLLPAPLSLGPQREEVGHTAEGAGVGGVTTVFPPCLCLEAPSSLCTSPSQRAEKQVLDEAQKFSNPWLSCFPATGQKSLAQGRPETLLGIRISLCGENPGP